MAVIERRERLVGGKGAEEPTHAVGSRSDGGVSN